MTALRCVMALGANACAKAAMSAWIAPAACGAAVGPGAAGGGGAEGLAAGEKALMVGGATWIVPSGLTCGIRIYPSRFGLMAMVGS